ncbi:DmsC/YnfH family molybdoenzyme membrane anchor subunit [Desulfitobacterium sp. PCE1]|uniref:dimethyl sulfoxide reductase anchor subunit family protein n=1 Tax=Desulfitobacterium sp. PCE1 TaxID=146907 RepID=UPI000371016E|nr:DmsC/YnfH family molybdoenzyme membrane anchor subunit [Desulfitobacterium sp. PCE1]
MEELALILFTISVQAAIGIMVFAAIAKQLHKDGLFKTAVLTSAVLAIAGLLASFLHLGHPLSAINALTRFATSWLSREIWFTSLFTGLTVLAALFIYFKPAAKSAVNLLVILAAVIGLIDVYAMASVYASTSIEAWQHAATFIEFYAAALSMGSLIFFALSAKEAPNLQKVMSIAVAAAIVVQAVGSFTAPQTMGAAMIIKWAAILVGAGLLFLSGKKKELGVSIVLGSTALVLLGQIVGRYIFFTL